MSQPTNGSVHHPMDIPGAAASTGVNVADMAVELHLAALELPQLSYALFFGNDSAPRQGAGRN